MVKPYMSRRLQGDIIGEVAPVSRSGDWVSGVTKRFAQSCNMCRLHSSPPQYVWRSHPYAPIQCMVWCNGYVFRRSQGDTLGDVVPASRSGEWGNGVTKTCVQWCNMCRLHCSPPLRTAHSHHTAPYANHAPRCESGRSQQMMGSLAGFHQLGECSSISITLLLVSQETAGRVSGSPHTPPIHCMVKPSNVWGNGVTATRFLLWINNWIYLRLLALRVA